MKPAHGKLRVVFTGHSGLHRTKVLETLATEFRRVYPKQTVSLYIAEDEIDDIPLFLRQGLTDQKTTWQRSIVHTIERWEKDAPDFAFLALHLTYHWHSHVFSPLSWRIPKLSSDDRLEDTLMKWVGQRFRPHYFVNLIDDIQAVQSRITTQKLLLRDLLKWRNAELMMTDILSKSGRTAVSHHPPCDEAKFPYEYSPLVAIRHPSSVVRRYLMQPKVLRVYASFPIGVVRRAKGKKRRRMVQEIDVFRATLSRHFTVFDPLTIDEHPIQIAYERDQGGNRRSILLKEDDQWQLGGPRRMLSEARHTARLSVNDVAEVATKLGKAGKSEIERHIERRDERLIDQADCVVIYRPTRDRKDGWSAGTRVEAHHALRMGRPIFVIRDPANDGELAPDALGIELAEHDHYEKTANLADPKNQKIALRWVIRELNRRAPEWITRRLGAGAGPQASRKNSPQNSLVQKRNRTK